MDLTERLARFGFTRPRPLLVVAPGATPVRLAVERELRERGWPAALATADADLLVVCGSPVPPFTDVAERLWEQMAAPRARVDVAGPNQVGRLAEGRRALLDVAVQRRAHRGRTDAAAGTAVPSGQAMSHASHAGIADHSEMEHGTSEHGGHGGHAGMAHPEGDPSPDDHTSHRSEAPHADHGGHAGMEQPGKDPAHHGHEDHGGHADMGHADEDPSHGGHGDHGSMAVQGLAMADRGDDRDGLKLDQLHVQFGPVLQDWPAGLVLRVTLQGDVVQEAAAELLPAAPELEGTPFWEEPWSRRHAGPPPTAAEAGRRRAAAHLDSVGRLLAVAGWAGAAVAARRLRDDLLSGAPTSEVATRYPALSRRVARSRLLRAMTRDLGVLTAAEAAATGVQGPALRAGGDVAARLLQWLEEIGRALAEATGDAPSGSSEGPRGRADEEAAPSRALLDAALRLVIGLDVAGARLVVASLDPDIDALSLHSARVAAVG